MNADKILFRASSVAHIMTEPKEKSNMQKYEDTKVSLAKYHEDYAGMKNKETKTATKKLVQIEKTKKELEYLETVKDQVSLSKGCKNHLADVFVSKKYGRKTNVHTRYTIKGLMVEEESITQFCLFTGVFYKKNEEWFPNEYICGTPDIIDEEVVIDIKSSWDIFTFFRTTQNDIKEIYYWQLQAYMALTGCKKAKLAYCLVNTPDSLIQAQKRKLMYDMGLRDTDDTMNADLIKGCEEIDKLSIYDDIPREEKIFEIEVERNDEDIEKMYERVIACRKYMNQYLFKTVNEIAA